MLHLASQDAGGRSHRFVGAPHGSSDCGSSRGGQVNCAFLEDICDAGWLSGLGLVKLRSSTHAVQGTEQQK